MNRNINQKINNIIIKAYAIKNNTKRNVQSFSPLDIPTHTVWKALGYSLFFSLVLGFLFLISLRQLAIYQLKENTTLISDTSKTNYAIARRIVHFLLPEKKDDFENADNTLKANLDSAFGSNHKWDISYNSFANFVEKSGGITNELAKLIVGNFELFGYNRMPADEVADLIGLKLKFNVPYERTSEEKWKRDIAISCILKFRESLQKNLAHPLRLVIALHGFIQWITFFSFSFCFSLLFLRYRWAKLQLHLVTDPVANSRQISWNTNFKNNLFAINAPELHTYYYLKDNFKNLFISERYITEVCNVLKNDVTTGRSIYDLMNQKINSLKQTVLDGEYLIINFLLWLIPSLGFIGTIIGIIGAMEGASGIFGATEPLNQIMALNKVAAHLGTAFDTTFVSLALISLLMLFNSIVQKREESIFSELEYVSNKYFIYELKSFYLKQETNSQNSGQ